MHRLILTLHIHMHSHPQCSHNTLYITHLLQLFIVFLELLEAFLMFYPLLVEKGKAQLNVFYFLGDRSLGPICVG